MADKPARGDAALGRKKTGESVGERGLDWHSLTRVPGIVFFVLVVLCAQALLIVGVVVWLLVEFFVEPPESTSTAVFLIVIAILAAMLWGAIIIGIVRRSPRSRGAAVFTQLLVLAVAAGTLQGDDPQWSIAIGLAFPAIVAGLVAVLSRRFAAHLGIDDDARRR